MLLSVLLSEIEYSCGNFRDVDIDSVFIDSRKFDSAQSVFVCIKGAVSNGHSYAESLYKKGCRVFVCSEPISLPKDSVVIYVSDTLDALAKISAKFYNHPSREMSVIGITGTKGKTSTSLMIYNVLSQSGISAGYIGSNGVEFLNHHFDTENTTPNALELQRYMRIMADSQVRCVVLEVSSQALFLKRVECIDFDICVFTNISPDHIGEFEHPTFEHYKSCKKSLFERYGVKTAVLNSDDAVSEEIFSSFSGNKTTYSIEKKSNNMASNIFFHRSGATLYTSFTYSYDKGKIAVDIPMPGYINVSNALAAISVCRELGFEVGDIVAALKNVRISGRFEPINALPYSSFIIDYAHNGSSMRSALESLRKYNPSRLICLFGTVGERTKMRRADLAKAACALADFSIITSDNPNFESPEAIAAEIASHFDDSSKYTIICDREKALKYAVSFAKPGDIFLIAGKGHERYQLVNGVKLPFCERDIIISEGLNLLAKK